MDDPAQVASVAAMIPGALVQVRDASGIWHRAVAQGGPEGVWVDGMKAHDFPVVVVKMAVTGDVIPWPLEHVVAYDPKRGWLR